MEKESKSVFEQLDKDRLSVITGYCNLQTIGRLKQISKHHNNMINIDVILNNTTSVAYCELGKNEKYAACTKALKHYEQEYHTNKNHAQIFKNLLKHCHQRRKKETQEFIKSHGLRMGLSRRAPCSRYELWIKVINENNQDEAQSIISKS